MSIESDLTIRPLQQYEQSLSKLEMQQLIDDQTQIYSVLGVRGLYASEVSTDDSLVANTNHQTILMFLQSKDDNLLVQLGGLIHAIIMCEPRQEIKDQVAVIFGANSIEDPKAFCKIKSQADLVDCCVQTMFMVPPYRNFTIKVFVRNLLCLLPEF